jgi:hypothetical protein
VHTEGVEGIVVAEPALTVVTMRKQTTPATTPMMRADMGCTKPEAGVMATSPATAPEMAPRALGLPLWIHSATLQPMAAAAVAKCVLTKALVARPPSIDGASGVEPEPAHPQQAGSDEAEHDGVRGRRFFGIADALAEIEGADQRRDAGGDVNHRAAGEVEAGNPCR